IFNTAAQNPALNKLPYFEECIKLSGATSEDLTPKPEKMTHESKCFFFCAMKKEGAIDATGMYKPKEIFRILKLYHGIEVPADQIKTISTCITALGKVSHLSAVMDPTKIPGFEECLESSGTTLEAISKRPVTLDHNVYCFFKCAHEKKGSLDADGNVVLDKLLDVANEHNLSADQRKTLTVCLEAVGKISACEDVEKITKCLMPMKS
ncbi:unnamed protein product, partial [Diabrotica balteata]